jgi:hypothetical protein
VRPNISEFSYGYALTENLVRWSNAPIIAAPVFPSLIQEGRTGGGYDVKLDFESRPLFIQFKLSDCMRNRNAREFQLNLFTGSYYRMYLRPSRYSNQHTLLLALERGGNDVYYAAPAFHEAAELNNAYIRQQVLQSSVFIRPLTIGNLPNEEQHFVSFQLYSPQAYLFSRNPIPIEVTNFDTLSKNIAIQLQSQVSNIETSLNSILSLMRDIIGHYFQPQNFEELESNDFRRLPVAQQIAYLSRIFFECEMFLVQKKT